eukprot:TRINITY_DN38367_c0_g1_i1.p1 TRINITY_DN38367_c0_g1~~TRINITY_DN38367_c0_g1_i1.p1  ORF type:complete len:110 (-),score=4.27 TRINITY_DN38367_c0_g1_i1:93-422(-)
MKIIYIIFNSHTNNSRTLLTSKPNNPLLKWKPKLPFLPSLSNQPPKHHFYSLGMEHTPQNQHKTSSSKIFLRDSYIHPNLLYLHSKQQPKRSCNPTSAHQVFDEITLEE